MYFLDPPMGLPRRSGGFVYCQRCVPGTEVQSAGLLLPLEVSGWLALPVGPTTVQAPARGTERPEPAG